ncbi:arsenate reductase family protein [Flavobacterium yafengii]|uniref:arsenate reductase family protein n=1 Tax=Flavobacterium yafengii TaxID=3041253 RepID=UPI0024A92C3E|nr:arsenate reductase family protein [Flavobacterium yafengii]MDI5897145.1 arsenate reductase family protein [Flavobacterium yafengii]MDI6046141.1 arsenate reductase family protein [Flavobacterium yafengii]
MIQIYHNSRCGKSRNCLAFIENSKKEFEVINYLINPPTYEELSAIIEKLNRKPIELVRQKEKIWIENFKDQKMNDKQIIQALISNPILIERPIIINGNSAIIGRDLEKVASFIL